MKMMKLNGVERMKVNCNVVMTVDVDMNVNSQMISGLIHHGSGAIKNLPSCEHLEC